MLALISSAPRVVNEKASLFLDDNIDELTELALGVVVAICRNKMPLAKGKLGELVDIIIQEKASLFVSAVGVPPKAVVDKLHGAGILCMNMIGHPKQ
jgi:NAD(P)H-dependent flavin oxidoreductase YrpB (nitropropane dioxygenase family)